MKRRMPTSIKVLKKTLSAILKPMLHLIICATATTIDGQTLQGNSGDEVRQFFSDLKPTNNTFSNTNYNIKIGSGGRTAWATYDQKTLDKEGKTLYLAHEIRFLENVNGVWKVVVLSAHHYKP